jgi:hypothetical protein
MDDYTFELYRELYEDTLSYRVRKDRFEQSQRETPRVIDQSRYLLSRVHLKKLAFSVASLAVVGVIFVGWLSVTHQSGLADWQQQFSQKNIKQITFSKDLGISLTRALANSRNYFSTELSRDRGNISKIVSRDLQVITDRVSSLEFLFRGTTATEKLNSFQLILEEWKLQTVDAFIDLESGNAEQALVEWTDKSEALSLELNQRASELSALAEDFSRREQLHLESIKTQYSTLLGTAWFLIFIVCVTATWMMANFIGAIDEFLLWFRKISWDLLAHSEKLSRNIDLMANQKLQTEVQFIEKDVDEMRLVFKRLLEAFSGNINGERFVENGADSSQETLLAKTKSVLIFEEGPQKMRNLLESKVSIARTPAEEQALSKAVGE